jgi:SAM-dependent methyltransferase
MADERANEQQIEYWNATAGPKWVALQDQLDEQLAPFGSATADALAPDSGESVLDVGCGCGATTLELGRRVGPRGAGLGVDISEIMLARARDRAARADASNVRFERGDFYAVVRFELPANLSERQSELLREAGSAGPSTVTGGARKEAAS